MSPEDQLGRLRVAIITGQLPRDLGEWAFGQIVAAMRDANRRGIRDALLRAAGDAVGGTRWARAQRVVALLEYFRDYPGALAVQRFLDGSAEALVQGALWVDARCPATARQILSILDD